MENRIPKKMKSRYFCAIFRSIFKYMLEIKQMTSIIFYGGVNEIGGNKILLTDKDTKVFLDFGKSFSRRTKYFEEYINPRISNGITDFLTMGLIPDIDGVYRNDLLEMTGKKLVDSEVDAVFLSHAHSDHSDYISFLNEKIPIYMGETCYLILQALADRSNRTFEREILAYSPKPSKYGHQSIQRKINTFRTGDKIKIGSLEVEPIHVDHSVPGAYGFIIWTTEGPIVYTGDIRIHGTHSQMSWDFIEKATQVKPIALIVEGTRVNKLGIKESEETVFKDSYKIISSTDRLVLADFNFKDVDRLRTFYDIAIETDRKLVIKLNDVYFLKYLAEDHHLDIPKLDDEHIIVYLPKRDSGKYIDKDYTTKEREFLNLNNIWTAEEIARNESKALCTIGFYNFNALIDMNLPSGAHYIHSASEPYNEEQEISQLRVNAWLNHFGIASHQSHCSGHAAQEDLIEIVSSISPKVIYPIHTEHPEIYQKKVKNTIQTKENIKYELEFV